MHDANSRRGKKRTAAGRITVTLPQQLLRDFDRYLVDQHERRSAATQRLIRNAVDNEVERQAVVRYVQAYREQPQTEEEFGFTDIVAADSLGHVLYR